MPIIKAEDTDMDTDGYPYMRSCDRHHSYVFCSSYAQAKQTRGIDFCDACRMCETKRNYRSFAKRHTEKGTAKDYVTGRLMNDAEYKRRTGEITYEERDDLTRFIASITR